MKKCFVTGCAGFIGSHFVDRLLQKGISVVGYDDFSTGFSEFIQPATHYENYRLVEGDLLDKEMLQQAMTGCDTVAHFAANADIRCGIQHPAKDLQQNTLATFNVLEAMRQQDIHQILFASTAAIYGEAQEFPTPENTQLPIQTSLYGASKLAAEGLIEAYCEGYGFQSYIFRFVSVLGERYSHGHVYDFYQQLQQEPSRIKVLGNGKQRKSYLYIGDCMDAIFHALENAGDKVNIFNLGIDDYCCVNDSLGWICDYLDIEPVREYTGGERGWVGDNPFVFLDCSTMKQLGWQAKETIQSSVIKTVQYLQENPWILQRWR